MARPPSGLLCTMMPPGLPNGQSVHLGRIEAALRSFADVTTITTPHQRPARDMARYIARLARAPRADFAWVRGSLELGPATRLARAKTRATILDINSIPFSELRSQGRGERYVRLFERSWRSAIRGASAIRVHNAPLRDAYVERFGLPPEKVHIVPIPVDVAHVPRWDPPAAGEPPSFVYVGSSDPWQGFPQLLDAFARFRKDRPDARLTIFSRLDAQALEAIRAQGLAGSVDVRHGTNHEVLAQLHRFTAMIIPRPRVETSETATPMKLVEAVAVGLPVVATDVGGVTTFLADAQAGLVVEPGDVAAIHDAMERLVSDAPLAAGLSRAGLAYSTVHTDIDAVSRRLESLVKDTLEREA